jgi:Holliday junction resolvase
MSNKSKRTSEKLDKYKKSIANGIDKDNYYKFDFFGQYKLEDGIKEQDFNKKWNKSLERQSGLIRYFEGPDGEVRYEKRDYSNRLRKATQRRIINQSRIVFGIFGWPHTGKSEIAQKIAKIIQTINYKYKDREIDIYIAFDTNEFKEKLQEMDMGDVAIKDEDPSASGKGSRTVEDNIDNVLSIDREYQSCYIFIAPYPFKHKLVDYYLETAGINKSEKKSRCILYSATYDEKHRISREPKGFVYFTLHEDEEFRERYEKRKHENIVKKHKNMSWGVSIDQEQFENDIDKLLGICKKQGVDTKKGIESKIMQDPGINKDTHYVEPLIEETYLRLNNPDLRKDNKNKDENEEEGEKGPQFTLPYYKEAIGKYLNEFRKFKYKRDFDELVQIIRREHPNLRSDFDIKIKAYNLITNKGLSQTEIAEKYKKFTSQQQVSYQYKKFRGMLDDVKGKTLEKDLVRYLKSTNLFLHVERIAGSGRPDVYAITEEENMHMYFSCKNYTINKKNTYIYRKDIFPSLSAAYEKFAREGEEVMVWLVFNDFGLNNCSFIPIDFLSTKKVYTMN